MDLMAHFGRLPRKPIERSISEHKFEDHRFQKEFQFQKGISSQENSYQQGTFFKLIALSLISFVSHMFHFPYSLTDSSCFEMDCDRAKDLRVNKESLVNGSSHSGHKIKEEIPLPPQRRFVQRISSAGY